MKNRFLSIVLASVMCLSLTACGGSKTTEPDKEKDIESTEDSYQYNISALLSEDNTYNQVLLAGFTDALTDYLGEEHFTITTSSVSDEANAEAITKNALSTSPDMIFTAGKSTLTAASTATDTVPILATGIVDFKGTLHIASLDGKAWDKTTGKNITGVSSKPSIVDQVSLMIESTDDLQTVGLLFSPEDTDAIYQNEIFEAYLDQAGIPWKEYLVPIAGSEIDSEEIEATIENSVQENEEDAEVSQHSTALTPSKYVAGSAKEGMDNEIVPLDEDGLFGLNSPSSTRVALISDYWTGPKVIPESSKASEETEEAATEEEASKNDKTSDEDSEEEEITLESQVALACKECSTIYIPFGSMLTDQMSTIGKIAEDEKVVIVAGDTNIGQNALVTLFADPYDLGYSAGKKAVKVFNGDDISTIKIGYMNSEDSVKLYNGKIAEIFGMEFPKSFSEFDEFLSTYEYGSNTERYSLSGE